MHLQRRPDEPVDLSLKQFYRDLLTCLQRTQVREGDWELLSCTPAWEGNWTSECFIGFAWKKTGEEALIAIVNYAPNQSQCYMRLPLEGVNAGTVWLVDQMGPSGYERSVDELRSKGLYLDMPAWGYHVFSVKS
jgi:hypothetical protein